MNFDLIGYINILIGITDILLGLFVWQGNKKKDLNKSYAFCTLTMGLWSFALYFYTNPLFLSSEIWLKIVYILAYLMTVTQIDFAIKYNKTNKKVVNKIFLYTISAGILYGLYALLIKDSVIIDVTQINNNSIAQMGTDYIFYALPIVISLFFLFSSFILSGEKLSGIEKKQSRLYWIGGFLMIAPLFILDFIFPIFLGITEYYKFSALGNILWSIIIAYSIFNTRFLDARVILGKLFKLLVRIIYIIFILLLTIFILVPKLNLDLSIKTVLSVIPVSIILALLFNGVVRLTDNLIEKKFVYSIFNPIDELQKYSTVNSKTLSIEKIIENTLATLSKTLKPESIYISIIERSSGEEMFSKNMNFETFDKKKFKEFLFNWDGLNSNRVLIYSEIKDTPSSGKKMIDDRKEKIIQFMKESGIEIVVPLEGGVLVSGVIMISEKGDNSIYSLGDINFLENIVQNMSLRVGQAALYKQVETFNESLKQKVSEQTFELQKKVKELEEARRKEADMIDIMGHELRTPMSVVKLNTDLLSNFVDKVNQGKEDFKKYLSRIKDSVDTEIKLINTLLSTAKLEGNKIELSPEKVNIVEQIKMSLHAHEKEAKDKNLVIKTSLEPGNTSVYADHARTVEVLNNLISNAIKYTDEGSITIKVAQEEGFVRVSVIDTGHGIAKEDIPKLGSKFYRTRNYINNPEKGEDVSIVRPGGTGLGLYVSFNLVKKMGGEMSVESEVGKGSNFTFTLPMYNNQDGGRPKDLESKDMFARLGLNK